MRSNGPLFSPPAEEVVPSRRAFLEIVRNDCPLSLFIGLYQSCPGHQELVPLSRHSCFPSLAFHHAALLAAFSLFFLPWTFLYFNVA